LRNLADAELRLRGEFKVVELLLESGADSSSRNAEGRTPLDEALLQSGQYAETYFPVQPNRTEEA